MKLMPPRIQSRRLALLLGFGLALALPSPSAQALIVVNQPWVKPAAARGSSEAYMNITATDGAVLVAARSDSAARVTLLKPGTGNRASVELPLPAGTIVELAPNRYRLSLRGLGKAIRLGDVVRLTLTIKDAKGAVQEIAVGAVARWRSPVDDERRSHKHRP